MSAGNEDWTLELRQARSSQLRIAEHHGSIPDDLVEECLEALADRGDGLRGTPAMGSLSLSLKSGGRPPSEMTMSRRSRTRKIVHVHR